MHTKTQSNIIATLIIATAIAGAYFMSASSAEAETRSLGVNRMASSTASTTKDVKTRPQVDATCMAAAVEVRETALGTAWVDLNTVLVTAFSERKTALVAAWQMSDAAARNTALKAAWKNWRDDKKAAHTEFRKDRKAAWDTFKTTAKNSCKMTVPKDEALEKTAKDSIAI